jgi:DNA-directed RNA polymerase specialized sigma24 family protein
MEARDFDEFYAAHFDHIARAISLAAGDRELARDATQERFARALRRWRTVRDLDRADGWVYVVAMNQLRDHWRRLERHRPMAAGVDKVIDMRGSISGLYDFFGASANAADCRAP